VKVLKNYPRFLAKSVFELREKEFWNYHRNELKRLGYPPSAASLIKASLLELLDFRETTRRVRRAVARKKKRKTSRYPEMGHRSQLNICKGRQ